MSRKELMCPGAPSKLKMNGHRPSLDGIRCSLTFNNETLGTEQALRTESAAAAALKASRKRMRFDGSSENNRYTTPPPIRPQTPPSIKKERSVAAFYHRANLSEGDARVVTARLFGSVGWTHDNIQEFDNHLPPSTIFLGC